MGMDELCEEDRMIVSRARKIQKFLSQPFGVAEHFTGIPRQYVPLNITVKSFRRILDGEVDNITEQYFFMKGGLDDVVEEYQKDNQ